jgi:hypothetical protein
MLEDRLSDFMGLLGPLLKFKGNSDVFIHSVAFSVFLDGTEKLSSSYLVFSSKLSCFEDMPMDLSVACELHPS